MTDHAASELVLLLSLVMRGSATVGARTVGLARSLVDAGCATHRGERRIDLLPKYLADVEARLDRVAPEWRRQRVALASAGLAPTVEALRRLALEERGSRVPSPERAGFVHRKVHASRSAIHSKARATPTPGQILTSDDCVRIRPHDGLVLNARGASMPASNIAEILGEVVVPERAFLDGLAFGGPPPRLAVTVENVGAYVDLPRLSGVALVHAPGSNTRLAAMAIERMKPTRVAHFGDLDPRGLRALRKLRSRLGAVEWFVPACFADYVEDFSHPCKWDEAADSVPELVATLIRQERWIEQEIVIGDPRLVEELRRLIPQVMPVRSG